MIEHRKDKGTIEYAHDERDLPSTVKNHLLITTVRVTPTPGHDYVTIWNRGGNAGAIVVDKGDGEEVARRLLHDYAEAVTSKLQYLINFMNELGLLEDGTFMFPDGDIWAAEEKS